MRPPREAIACPCGTPILRVWLPLSGKWSSNRYCSPECRSAALGERNRTRYHPPPVVQPRPAATLNWERLGRIYRDDQRAVANHGSPGTVSRPPTHVHRTSTLYVGTVTE